MTNTMLAKPIFSLVITMCLYAPLGFAQGGSDTLKPEPWADHYQKDLAEQMLIDGRRMLEQGRYADAEGRFFDAMQITRVGNGITTPLQIPILELLVRSQLPQKKWKTIQQYLSYFDWLNSELYRINVADYLASTEILSALYLQASADIENPSSGHYLVAAKHLNWNAVSAVERIYGRDSKLLTPWLYRIVLNHFYESALVKRRGLTSYDYKTDEPVIVNGWSLSRNEFLQKNYNIGFELLERIRDIESAGDNLEAEAMAWLYLADWEVTFNNGAKAIESYQKASGLLLKSGIDQRTVDSLFAQTSVLPEPVFQSALADLIAKAIGSGSTKQFSAWSANFPAAANPATAQGLAVAGDSIHAIIRFDYNLRSSSELAELNPYGKQLTKSNMRLVSISEPIEAAKAQALYDVALLNLRPQLVSGKLVPSEGITVDYVFSPQTIPMLLSDK